MIHVCDSENRNGKGWLEGIQLGDGGGGGQGRVLKIGWETTKNNTGYTF